MNNIDYQMLREQIDFLTLLVTDIELGNVVLPTKYYTLDALPAEYIDGACNLLDTILEEGLANEGSHS
jgi:hypothetical protein